ncbi:MAG: hypothetical protein IIA48_02815 [Bacteroidetes bacterium]|nr:hypothetical protein [Bacteroidota bacterium]
MYIIIDKSWIINIKKESLINICENNFLVLPSPLAYETFTSHNKEQSLSIWRKLNYVKEKVCFIERINQLIKYEIKHKESFGSIDRFFVKMNFDANIERILKGLKIRQKIILLWYKIIWESRYSVNKFKHILEGIHNYFPLLEKQSKREIFSQTLNELCENKNLLLRIYNEVKPSKFPTASLIDNNWAVYCWLQLHLIYAVEYKRKYGFPANKINYETLCHDHIDVEYLMLGVLNKSLATDDNNLKSLFKISCKDGVLFSNN